MTNRKLLAATVLLAATAFLTACGAGADNADNNNAAPQAPATQATSPVSPPNAPPIAEPNATTDPATDPATTPPTQRPAGVAKDDGCPVSTAALLKIANATPGHVPTVALTGVTCHSGWATAGQQVGKEHYGKVQPVTFLFRYDAKSRAWAYASSGTGGICPDSMPASIRKQFPACAG